MDIAGERSGEGSRLYDGYRPGFNSTLFDRYEAAGLITFAKTTSPEFGLTVTTESVATGLTRNPWDHTRTSGGSSGGAAVAVAAGVVPMAQASDGGGSIRAPASCCGVFGMKPSRGRMPLGPHHGKLAGTDRGARGHPVGARFGRVDGRDPRAETGSRYTAPAPSATFLDAVGRPPPALRIAMMLSPMTEVRIDQDVIAATHATARLLESLGHIVEEAQPDLPGPAISAAFAKIIGVHTARDVDTRVAQRGIPLGDHEIEPVTAMYAHIGRKTTGLEILAANELFQDAAIRMARFMTRFDVILSPVMGKPPIELGKISLSPLSIADWTAEITAFSPFTALYNITGQPAMSVPLAWSASGLPIGMMFAGRYGYEAGLFALAGQLEQAAPWEHRRP